MKKVLFIGAICLFALAGWAQEGKLTLSGGYSFANLEDYDTGTSGWRINGLYEFQPLGSKVSHGFSFGYINTSADFEDAAGNSTNFRINTWPVYYAPKLYFGNGSAKPYLKGALGWQFAGLKRTGYLGELSSTDAGFYGGLGLGFIKTFKESSFITIEYEWAYMSNSFYRDGFMNSIMLGVGKML